jgi:hypothetical protein
MKSLTLRLFLVFLIFPLLGFLESQFWSLDQATKTWGITPFSAEKFKTATPRIRAAMSVDLLKSGFLMREKFQHIEKLLGKSETKFQGHHSLAYHIGGDGTDEALLVFLPDPSGSRVEDIQIGKVELSVPEGPTKTGASVGTKVLPVNLQGDAAKSIFEQMANIKEDHFEKRGKNITCHRSPSYECEFTVDDQGRIEAK